MIGLTHAQSVELRPRFLPDRPGPLSGLHWIETGHGRGWVDRWPRPRAILVETAGNYSLSGDPEAIQPDNLRPLIKGFVEASGVFVPLLRETFPSLAVWERVIFELLREARFESPARFDIRRLSASDGPALARLSPESAWISKTWGGGATMAATSYACGAFAGERLVAVANTFFVGDRYEDLGVVTEPEFRGLGLGTACAGMVCREVLKRGRISSWTTSPDNAGSVRVAEKLGFTLNRRDVLYAVGVAAPEPPRPPSA
jgi:RimJ/RimL family protein N-acetyltransferase